MKQKDKNRETREPSPICDGPRLTIFEHRNAKIGHPQIRIVAADVCSFSLVCPYCRSLVRFAKTRPLSYSMQLFRL